MSRSVGWITAAATALMMAGCSGGNTARDEVIVSFSDLSQPFFVAMRRELEDEARKQGVAVQVLDGQNNSSKQVADLEAAAVQGAGAVIVAPTDAKALASAVDALADQDIVVASVDRRVEGSRRPVPHFGADNVAGGRALADWVVRTYPQGARVAVITNDPGSSSSIERVRGVHEGLDAGGGAYRIVAEQTGNSKRDQALTVTQNILTAAGAERPDVILCLNDDMAMGALEALHGAGLGPDKVAVLGFDAIPEALSRIKDGRLAATVEQNPGRQVRTALRDMLAALKAHKPVASVTIAPVLITRANLAAAARIAEAGGA